MIKQSTLFLSFSSILLFIILMGCAKLQKSYPERNYYILDASQEDHNSSPTSGAVLEIQRFDISPGFAGKEFIYRMGEVNYVSDFYNQFFSPPAWLITEEVRNWLSESGPFKYIVDSTNDVSPNYVLEGNINELYGDFRKTDSLKAVMGIQFFLIEQESINPQIVFQNNYRREVIVSDNSPEALVKGWNEALIQILTALHDDFNKLDLDGDK